MKASRRPASFAGSALTAFRLLFWSVAMAYCFRPSRPLSGSKVPLSASWLPLATSPIRSGDPQPQPGTPHTICGACMIRTRHRWSSNQRPQPPEEKPQKNPRLSGVSACCKNFGGNLAGNVHSRVRVQTVGYTADTCVTSIRRPCGLCQIGGSEIRFSHGQCPAFAASLFHHTPQALTGYVKREGQGLIPAMCAYSHSQT